MDVIEIMKMFTGGTIPEKARFPATRLDSIGIEVPDVFKSVMKAKQCFVNASKITGWLGYQGYDVSYAEGFVTYDNKIPLEHAFIILRKDGKTYVVDPTFEFVMDESEDELNSEDYYIIREWSPQEMREEINERRKYGPWWNER